MSTSVTMQTACKKLFQNISNMPKFSLNAQQIYLNLAAHANSKQAMALQAVYLII